MLHIEQSRLQNQQFLKDQTITAFQHRSFLLWEMNLLNRVGRTAQMMRFNQFRRQPLCDLPDRSARLLLPRAQICLRQTLGQWVNRKQPSDILRITQLMKFRMRHLAASVIERDLSEKSHLLTGFEIGF